jgi:hypothetical protein
MPPFFGPINKKGAPATGGALCWFLVMTYPSVQSAATKTFVFADSTTRTGRTTFVATGEPLC